MTCCLTHPWTDEDGTIRCSNKLEVSCSQTDVHRVFSVGTDSEEEVAAAGESSRDVR
jgi:hypothetical protein